MPVVIKPVSFLENKKSLSFEGFFVDTNIIISYQDPFGQSSLKPDHYERIQESIHLLKSIGYKTFSTISVALEYYKHIQYNSYTLYFQKNKFDSRDFKLKKINHPVFSDTWSRQMKSFKKLFSKAFPFYDKSIGTIDINSFDFLNMDFGDHLLLNTLEGASSSFKAVFSNDKDFYNISDDIFLITLNSEVLSLAQKDKKLHQQLFK